MNVNTQAHPSAASEEAIARHHGLPLLPHPTQDERDPLRWPRGLKIAALGATACFNFTANFAGSGLTVGTPVLEAQFHKTPNRVNALLTSAKGSKWNFLLLGLGNLFWVPLAVKFGKRASLLTSMAMLFAVLIWTAKEPKFNALVAARCLSGFASAAGESVVPSIVSDIFFLHERAAMMSAYTILIASATAIGPLLGSFIVQYSPGTWRDFVWVCAGLSGANLVAIFCVYPESNFHRPDEVPHMISPTGTRLTDTETEKEKGEIVRTETVSWHRVSVVKKPWTKIWTSFITVDPNVSLPAAFYRPIVMMFRPSVLFAVFMYGTALASQIVLIFAFPNFLMAPPYLFSGIGVGLMQVAAIIAFVIGCFGGGYAADIITAKTIIRQGGVVYPEQRLLALIPGCLISPAGCILIAFSCSEKLHWIAIAFGFGMVSFGTIYAPNVAITYVVECFPKAAAECLVAINAFKNLVAFLFLYTAVDWVASQGWIQVYMIMFMLVSLSMLSAIPFYFFGAKWRERAEHEPPRD
ncbi:hypothetical protein N0V90_013212 [Kalmusia sp. IMI 367209]|nr:hypothetical protein N0V90_013212 [Kalmusia sp. IMI 367209]